MRTTAGSKMLKKLQQDEVNGAALYVKVAAMTRNAGEKETLLEISREEYKHVRIFEKYSGARLKPDVAWVSFNAFMVRVLGYTFITKVLKRSEEREIAAYKGQIDLIPELAGILAEEEAHEEALLGVLKEERLQYLGDVVLGMNDALVELTGSLAGYTLAMQNTGIIAMAGLITGISATLSIASSEYLSSREAGDRNAVKSAAYTGLAYLVTVSLLILPYLVFPVQGYIPALLTTLLIAICIIACFSYYSSVVKGRPFKRNFLSMAGMSMGVAAVSFAVGLLVKKALGINM